LRFQFNIYTMAEARDFKFGTQLGSAKAHHENHTRKIVGGRGLGLETHPNIWGSLQYFCNGRALLLALAELPVENVMTATC